MEDWYEVWIRNDDLEPTLQRLRDAAGIELDEDGRRLRFPEITVALARAERARLDEFAAGDPGVGNIANLAKPHLN